MSEEIKKQSEANLIYPDQLNIIIRTSIPGYQKIMYKPSMTIKDTTEQNVRFNPMFKLNQSVINKIPEEYRIKQFFNKGLFDSLLIYNGGKPATNLVQATRSGYVDNNINVTLHSIFPSGSVIYVGKKPYVIIDQQWTSGDWNIEVKQKKQEVDPSKIKDPQLYTQLVNDEIISGEEQLNQLPSSTLVGENYSGPLRTSPSPNASSPNASSPNASSPNASSPTTTNIGNQIDEKEDIHPSPPPIKPNSGELTMFSPKQEQRHETLSLEEEKIFETFKQYIQINIKNTSFFRNYFQSQNYKHIIQSLFSNFSKQLQTQILQFYVLITNSNSGLPIDELSHELYTKLCNQVSIIESPSNGDCFFKTVADGINIYNYENQESKISYANYGITSLFTTSVLREIVYRYIEGLGQEIIENMLIIAHEQLEVLNDKFKDSIEGLRLALNVPHITKEQYLTELANIYNANPNFMIFKPSIVPIYINEYENPFRVVKKSEIKQYIASRDYWANDVAIEAICDKLHISIIPIEKYNYKSSFRLKSLLTNNQLTKEKCSKKVMYLFYEKNHYELIRFTYFIKPLINKDQTTYQEKWYTIFKDTDFAPPVHILMLIYGTIYSTLNKLSQNNFAIYKHIMKEIDHSVFKLLINEPKNFSKDFDDIFPNKNTIEFRMRKQYESNTNLIQPPEEQQVVSIKGGQPYKYSTPKYITKKPDEQNRSKIAYTITIDMELHPGTSLTPEQMSKSKCTSKYNTIKKAFSEFTGKPYVIKPVYPESKNNTIKNKEQVKGGRRKTRKHR
jgi:hypothetical protein